MLSRMLSQWDYIRKNKKPGPIIKGTRFLYYLVVVVP